jgi:hypothetical protein
LPRTTTAPLAACSAIRSSTATGSAPYPTWSPRKRVSVRAQRVRVRQAGGDRLEIAVNVGKQRELHSSHAATARRAIVAAGCGAVASSTGSDARPR